MGDRTPKDRYVLVATYANRTETWAYATEAQADAQDKRLAEDGMATGVTYTYVRGYRGEQHRVVWH